MGRSIRGFLLKHRVNTLFRRYIHRKRSKAPILRLNPRETGRTKALLSLISWTRSLRTKVEALVSRCRLPGRRGYTRVGGYPIAEKPEPVPKGHMAVYVGQEDCEAQRILVPVVYINHPLFGDLLKESEKEYGFKHPGCITIPCRIAEFEEIQTRIRSKHVLT